MAIYLGGLQIFVIMIIKKLSSDEFLKYVRKNRAFLSQSEQENNHS